MPGRAGADGGAADDGARGGKKSLEHVDLPLEQKRRVIDMLAQEYPVSVACKVLGSARSSYYYRPVESPDEGELKVAIKSVAAEWPTYGYRRVAAQLRCQEWLANHKRVQRLMGLMGIQAKIERRKRCTTNSEHDFPCYPSLVQELEVVRPEQVWVPVLVRLGPGSDITYSQLRYDFVYLAVIKDIFTRGMRGWRLGRSLDHILTLTALQRALARHPAPEIHHSDQGIQYAATAYTQVLSLRDPVRTGC